MSLIVGAPPGLTRFETVALDNSAGYGLTQVAPGTKQSYDDFNDLVGGTFAYEQARDDRPIICTGPEVPGNVTHHVAAKALKGTLRGIVGMTFWDQRDQSNPRCHRPRQVYPRALAHLSCGRSPAPL